MLTIKAGEKQTVSAKDYRAVMKNHFAVERLYGEKMIQILFQRGEYVLAFAGGNNHYGCIIGISHARKEFRVGGAWYAFGCAYKTPAPVAQEKKVRKTKLSKIVAKMNADHGGELTESDRVSA
jgi:hypothetical protein